jgi:hypothetical protein
VAAASIDETERYAHLMPGYFAAGVHAALAVDLTGVGAKMIPAKRKNEAMTDACGASSPPSAAVLREIEWGGPRAHQRHRGTGGAAAEPVSRLSRRFADSGHRAGHASQESSSAPRRSATATSRRT